MFRKMRRFKQQLTEEECRKVLSEGERGTLGVNGDDGYPYTIPTDYYFDPDTGSVFFHSAVEGHKIDSIRKNDKVSFNVLSSGWKNENEWWLQFNSVTIFGRIRVIEDKKTIETALRAIGRKYFPDEASAEEAVQKDLDHVFILELVPEHMTGKHVNEN